MTEKGIFEFFSNALGGHVNCKEVVDEKEKEDLELTRITFNSKRKRGTTVVKVGEDTVRIFCKGAPDFLLKDVTRVLASDGSIADINDDDESAVPQWLEGQEASLNINPEST